MFKQTIYFLAVLLVIGFSACADETFDPVLEIGNAPAFTEPGSGEQFEVTENNLGGELTTITWEPATFSVPTEVRYILEADLAGGDFSDGIVLMPSSTNTSFTVTSQTINSFLIGQGIEAGTATDIIMRVIAFVGRRADGNVLTSEMASITVTPFAAEVEVPKFYVPGAYQGWSPDAENVGVLYSPMDNGVFTGYINFGPDGSEFKFTPQPNWDVDYGDTGADGMLEQTGDNIMSAGTGYHLVTLDFNELTFTQTPTSWGLIGNATATGWDSDTDFTLDPDSGLLTITADLAAGEDLAFKFRANDAWDINLGDNDGDGTLEPGGENIAVATSGNYTITLDLLGVTPTYTITQN